MREGSDVTLVSAMKGVHDCLAAAEMLAGHGVAAEVIDLRTLRPLDADSILPRSQDEPDRRRRGGPAHRRLGRRGARARHRAGLGDIDDAWRIATENTRSRTARRSRTRSCPGRNASPPRSCAGYGKDDGSPPSAASSPSKVGSRLRQERERRGMSLRELARRVGVSPSLVSQIELDRVNPLGEHALRPRLRARDDDERRVRRRNAAGAPRPPFTSRDDESLRHAPRHATRDQPRLRSALGAPHAAQRP